VSLAIHALIEHAARQARKTEEIVIALDRLGAHIEQLRGGGTELEALQALRKLGDELKD
jgi:serine O-acetyltransferase